MVKSATLGMPRIGKNCEMSDAVSSFINKKIDHTELQSIGKKIRLDNLQMQVENGIDIIPSNDFTFFDHVLDTTVLLGNIPRKYYWEGGPVSLDIYFTMITGQQRDKFDVTPMNIGRWFNTNYLYLLPEFSDPVEFVYSDNKHVLAYLEAKQKFQIKTRPVFLGPISYVLMGKVLHEDSNDINKLQLIDEMMPVYEELFINCKRLGITDIQFEEHMLIKDLTRDEQIAYKDFYHKLSQKTNGLKIHLIISYGDIGNNLECVMSLPVSSIHLDLVAAPQQLDKVLELLPETVSLSLGLVDANNLFINDLNNSIAIAKKVIDKIGSDRVIIGPSSSLFLCPLDVSLETKIPKELNGLLSFTLQKIKEISIITKVLNGDKNFDQILLDNAKTIKKISSTVNALNKKGQPKLDQILNQENNRKSTFKDRIEIQKQNIFKNNQSIMPITLNGKLPYINKIETDTEEAIKNGVKLQEEIGIDIISDGELDRYSNNDFFAKELNGVFVPENGFVQYYGNMYNKISIIYNEPISKKMIYGDIAKFVLSLTEKPVKISVAGPITFVSQSYLLPNLSSHYIQILVSDILQKEMKNLEDLGVKIIAIDEQNFLQSLPLRNEHINDEINKIVNIFKYSCSLLKNKTQVHTKILYAQFDEFLEDFAKLDSDVLFINTSRIQSETFESFISYRYPNHISLGIYDSLSDRIPTNQEIALILKKYSRSLELDQIWISPDVGFEKDSMERFSKVMNIIIDAVKEFRLN